MRKIEEALSALTEKFQNIMSVFLSRHSRATLFQSRFFDRVNLSIDFATISLLTIDQLKRTAPAVNQTCNYAAQVSRDESILFIFATKFCTRNLILRAIDTCIVSEMKGDICFINQIRFSLDKEKYTRGAREKTNRFVLTISVITLCGWRGSRRMLFFHINDPMFSRQQKKLYLRII